MDIKLNINGVEKNIRTRSNAKLIDVLRDEGYFGVKKGCGEGECGACLVLVDGIAVNSCLMYAALLEGKEIVTIEGLGTHEKMNPIQEELLKAGAVQCGYCIPGMVISATQLLRENSSPTEAEIKKALDGNLCRCTGYVKQIEGIKNAARRRKGERI